MQSYDCIEDPIDSFIRPITTLLMDSLSTGGLIYSFPGSADQSFHGDGPHLYNTQLPPHAINIFIPLTDITPELGPTEFIPKSHLLSHVSGINKMLESSLNLPKGEVVSPLITCGDLLLYDYRTIHRGVRNITPATCRCGVFIKIRSVTHYFLTLSLTKVHVLHVVDETMVSRNH